MASSSSQQPPEKFPSLHPNDVFAEGVSSSAGKHMLHRLLWLSYHSRQAVVFDILEDDMKLRAPYFKDLDEIETYIKSGHWVATQFHLPKYMLLSDKELKKKHRKKRNLHWGMLKHLLDQKAEPAIYLPENRGPLIASIADANHKTRRAIRSLLYRAFKYGRIRNAVLPQWPACGAVGVTREPKTAKRGRKPKVVTTGHAPEKAGINVDKETRQKILLGVDLFCSLDDRVTTAKAWRDTKDKFFVEHQQGVNGKIITVSMPTDRVPKEWQFRYYVNKRLQSVDFMRKRVGERVFQQQMRAITGTARSELLGPGHLFEIDSTIGDIYLLSRYNPTWVIGRPVIYVVVDTFSRLIVGLYIGLIGPSWEGARLALANAFSDKVPFCAKHGITISPEQWPAHHFPYYLAADRAELLSKAAEVALNNLPLELCAPGPYRPDWKGVVESRFRLLNEGVIEWMPGAVRQRLREMRKRQYVLDATLNMEEFTHVIINCVLEHNNCIKRKGLLTKDMIAGGVEPYSVDMWNWGVANLTGPLRTEDPDLIRAHLLPSATATVTERGILYKDLLYTCDRAVQEQWFVQARVHKDRKVSIRPEYFTNTIYLAPPSVPEFLPCRLLDPEERYANLRREEALDCIEYLKLHDTDLSDRDERAQHALRADSNTTIQTAVERKRKRGKAKGAIDADEIREHRKIEKEMERLEESRAAQQHTATVTKLNTVRHPIAAPLVPNESNLLDLLRAQRDKKWDGT